MAGSIGPAAATEQDVFVPKLHQITQHNCDAALRHFPDDVRPSFPSAIPGRAVPRRARPLRGVRDRLQPGWHADHVKPVSAGGATEPANGQALCPRCNLEKGARPA